MWVWGGREGIVLCLFAPQYLKLQLILIDTDMSPHLCHTHSVTKQRQHKVPVRVLKQILQIKKQIFLLMYHLS